MSDHGFKCDYCGEEDVKIDVNCSVMPTENDLSVDIWDEGHYFRCQSCGFDGSLSKDELPDELLDSIKFTGE